MFPEIAYSFEIYNEKKNIWKNRMLNFRFFEKATKFDQIFPVD